MRSEALVAARALSDALFATLRPPAFLERPVAERHRLVFYRGHLDAFDWNLLVKAPSRNPRFEQLFAFGIDPLDELPRDRPEDWPPLDEIGAWVTHARAAVDERWSGTPELDAMIAVEHRLMHIETLSYLFEQLAPGRCERPPPSLSERAALPQAWLDIPQGPITLGRRRAQARLGWGNEFEGHDVQVPALQIESRKTTNGDWLNFIAAGGYRERRFWTDDDWSWRERDAVDAPLSWRRRGEGFTQWVNGHDVPLQAAWPVYVSHAEARAYAAFRSARLPTEAEWHRAVHGTAQGDTREYPWGEGAPRPGLHGNFGFAQRHPLPVGSHPQGSSAFGLDEPVGNGWEWTSSPFAPFPGFEPLPQYPGYSAPFFDGRHFVVAGASAVTALPLLRRTFRNWYQPHYRAVFATVRLARDPS